MFLVNILFKVGLFSFFFLTTFFSLLLEVVVLLLVVLLLVVVLVLVVRIPYHFSLLCNLIFSIDVGLEEEVLYHLL